MSHQDGTNQQPAAEPADKKEVNNDPTAQRCLTLSVPVPRRVSLAGATAVTGSSALAAAIASGHAPTEPVYVYSLVALSIATMAYDIAHKALRLRGA
ncbi:hypothetical protein [Streptomyces xantholiticus]|uniref:Uncharacterized protein n=1 Tax=Streptomyces xantholiticus TaxID=68285 RepID=A0ABV1UPP8_9ACTN